MSQSILRRNDPCHCGSGKKYKKCHLGADIDTAYTEEPLSQTFGALGLGPMLQHFASAAEKDFDSIAAQIVEQRDAGTRPLPSQRLMSIGDQIDQGTREFIVDTCAKLVDVIEPEPWMEGDAIRLPQLGRSDMCVYFAVLVRHALALIGIEAVVEVGKATYRSGGEDFEWDHAWVRTAAGDLIDGNVDSMRENPMVPEGIDPDPYWGPAGSLPADRSFKRNGVILPEADERDLEATEIGPWKLRMADFMKGHLR